MGFGLGNRLKRPPAQPAAAGRRRALIAAAALVAMLSFATVAVAGWNSDGSGGSYSKARSLPAGNAPTTSISGRNVTVSWTSASFVGGGPSISDYTVKRYNTGGTLQTIGAGCAGTVSALTCTENNVPAGSWKYSVTPKAGSNWVGTESSQSVTQVVSPASYTLSGSSTLNSLPQTLNGNLAAFMAGQTVSFRLDNATTGTVLSGSISPTPIQSSGSATTSVTIPAGTSDGTHTIFAIGSQGDVASAQVTVDVLDHFTIDPISQQHSGRSFLVTVSARNAANSVVTGYNGTVTFSANSGTISPTTSSQMVNGTLTQAVTITGSYSATQTITATGAGKVGTSNVFTLHDWRFYFKKTTGNTGTNCGSATRVRDMEEGYTGADPEELFSRTTGGAVHLRFCSPTFTASDDLAAGTTTVQAYVSNAAGSSCGVTVTIYKNSGGTLTSLGSSSLTIPQQSSTTLRTWTITTTGTNFASGDRLNVSMVEADVKACGSTDIHYGGTVNRSNVVFPGPTGSG
jgi:hypothetical protein